MIQFNYYKTGSQFDSTSLNNDDIAFVEDTNSVYTHGTQFKFMTGSIPTISTDISADASSDTKTASPKAVKTYVDNNAPTVMSASGSGHKGGLVPDTPSTAGTAKFLREDGTWTEVDQSGKENVVGIVVPVNQTDATDPITALSCEVGKYYRLDVAVETLAVTLPAMTDLTTVRTVVIYLTAGTTPAVTIAAADSKDVYYQDGFEIEAGKTYEINALFNGAAWIIAAVQINVE